MRLTSILFGTVHSNRTVVILLHKQTLQLSLTDFSLVLHWVIYSYVSHPHW